MKPKASQCWTFMQNMSHLLNSEVFPSLLSRWNQPKNYHWLQTPGELATVYSCVNNGILNFRTWSKIVMSKLKTKPSRNLNFKSKWNGKKHKGCQFVVLSHTPKFFQFWQTAQLLYCILFTFIKTLADLSGFALEIQLKKSLLWNNVLTTISAVPFWSWGI